MTGRIVFLIGVSGCGKTTVGQALSDKTGFDYYDADDFHPEANISRMKKGKPLNDEDRKPWLESINEFLASKSEVRPVIMACSALKRSYRHLLVSGIRSDIYWFHLKGDYELILERMMGRSSHFMPAQLLQSQFDSLELSNDLINIDISASVDDIVSRILRHLNMHKEFGLMGLGVMGKSLARNLARNGVALSVYNRHVEGLEENVAGNFIMEYPEMENSLGFDDLESFVLSLTPPRKIFLMLTAGKAVDAAIDELIPYLAQGDLIIDGGNSLYKDTQRRSDMLETEGLLFIGTGVSGGEKGALEGPSIMPGGSREAYDLVKSYLTKIAAKDKLGNACCNYIGHGGAGHFVKMVHNGVEYGEMQLLAEVYGLLKYGYGQSHENISAILEYWQSGELHSYLLGITIDILRRKEGGDYLLDLILDKAGNKGTGSWTTIAACELGVPIPTLTSALLARYVSSFKSERTIASALYPLAASNSAASISELSEDLYQSLEKAYKLARIINHHQGIHLIAEASKAYNWDIDLSEVARIWTNGCIIRSSLMEELVHVLTTHDRILLNPSIQHNVQTGSKALAEVVSKASQLNVPVFCFGASLQYFNTYTQAQSTANLLQAQRDYFGAHTYRRIDKPGDASFHTDWTSSKDA